MYYIALLRVTSEVLLIPQPELFVLFCFHFTVPMEKKKIERTQNKNLCVVVRCGIVCQGALSVDAKEPEILFCVT